MTEPVGDDGLGSVEAETAALVAALGAFLVAQRTVLLRRLRRSAIAAGEALPLDVVPIPLLSDEWDGDVWDAQLGRVIAGRSLRIGSVGAAEVLDRYNPERAGWSPDVMARYLIAASGSHASAVNRQTYEAVAAALAAGPSDGWEDRVRVALEERRGRVPLAIGSGIAAESRSFGGYDAARASGLTTKTWRVSSGKPRASHAAIDGLTVPLNAVFPNGARWPGDAFAGSAESAGCHCYLEFGVL